ncbi:MAG: hypothetical protein ACHREM_01585 [Polyangiales bacterium]
MRTSQTTATSADFHGQGGIFNMKPGITTLTAKVGTSKARIRCRCAPER